MKRLGLFLVVLSFPALAAHAETAGVAGTMLKQIDAYTLAGERNMLTEIQPLNADGTVNAIVEIPTGTNAAWAVNKEGSRLEWAFKKGSPQLVQYLSYPANYGMIPRTAIASSDESADADPLDVVIIGSALPRGEVVRAKVLGVLQLLDGGRQDDKLIAVHERSPMYNVNDIGELRDSYPGVMSILLTWFLNYKGPGMVETKGYQGPEIAADVIRSAARLFEQLHPSNT